MSEKDINRWGETITPRDKAPQPWKLGSGGSWDMLEVQPIPDEMLAELAQQYSYSGAPWNCRSLPLSPSDREYMYLLYYSMQGLVARVRRDESRIAELERQLAKYEALIKTNEELLRIRDASEEREKRLFAAAQTTAQQDARDAARYRWLRDKPIWSASPAPGRLVGEKDCKWSVEFWTRYGAHAMYDGTVPASWHTNGIDPGEDCLDTAIDIAMQSAKEGKS